jgi:predicted RNase H-like nuclease (RuvC/YqgF family)
MEFDFPVTEVFDTCIRRVDTYIGNVDQPVPPAVQNLLQQVRDELIEGKRRAQEKEAIAEENEDDHIRSIVRRELDIFQQDDVIKNLREDVTELQTRLTETQNNLEQTQNELEELITNQFCKTTK